ncbi:hypothetical protein TNCV_270251 [Trichonephila clavipes]|nr:hypothetical protein TNCV_270251 [Trichonephila clavipes]
MIKLEFCVFPNGDGVKARGKVAGYANANRIGRQMIPLNRRSATVPLNRNRSIHAKRNNFPLKPACSLTIYKSCTLPNDKPIVLVPVDISVNKNFTDIIDHETSLAYTEGDSKQLGKQYNALPILLGGISILKDGVFKIRA